MRHLSWLLRFLGWATVISLPCYMLMRPYQGVLAAAGEWVLAQVGMRVRIGELRLQEPFNIGVFGAMGLASLRTPTRRRLSRLGGGMLALAVFDLGVVVAVVGAHEMARWGGRTIDPAMGRFVASWIEAIPWVSAPVLWALLYGRAELAEGARIEIGSAKRRGSSRVSSG